MAGAFPETLKAMKDHLERLKQLGAEGNQRLSDSSNPRASMSFRTLKPELTPSSKPGDAANREQPSIHLVHICHPSYGFMDGRTGLAVADPVYR